MNIKDLQALRQLGMRCLVIDDNGCAIAFNALVKISESGAWQQAEGYTPHLEVIHVQKLDNFHNREDWQNSQIDLNNACPAW